MREPKYSDAPCFGKEFEAKSKVCRVCLGNKSCRQKYLQTFGGLQAQPVAPVNSPERIRLKAPAAAARRHFQTASSA